MSGVVSTISKKNPFIMLLFRTSARPRKQNPELGAPEDITTFHGRSPSQRDMVNADFTQEITGFVLAALPLMISALEHYRESAEVLESWWKIKREYQKCMRNLKYHKVSFEAVSYTHLT